MTCHPQGFLQRVGNDREAGQKRFEFPEQRLLSTRGITIRQALHERDIAEESRRAMEHELRETRAALGDTEQELLEVRDARSAALAELERQAYWLERGESTWTRGCGAVRCDSPSGRCASCCACGEPSGSRRPDRRARRTVSVVVPVKDGAAPARRAARCGRPQARIGRGRRDARRRLGLARRLAGDRPGPGHA